MDVDDDREFIEDEGPNCFSFQFEIDDAVAGGDDQHYGNAQASMVLTVSPKHHHKLGASGNPFQKGEDSEMVEIGTSSIDEVARAEAEVCYAEESFIAANANQHEETMFDDDITSALLNGINSNQGHMNNNSHNTSNHWISTTPRDAVDHSNTATDGSLNQSLIAHHQNHIFFSNSMSFSGIQNISVDSVQRGIRIIDTKQLGDASI